MQALICCNENSSTYMSMYLFVIHVAPTSPRSYSDLQLLSMEKEPTRTGIGLFACMTRTDYFNKRYIRPTSSICGHIGEGKERDKA